MRRATLLTLALVSAALTAGCMTATPQQLQNAQAARAEAQDLLDSFAVCIRRQDASGLRPLVAPSLAPSEFQRLAIRLEAASWLRSYKGYALDAGPALQHVSWRDWEAGRVEVYVPVTNDNGDSMSNRFVLTRGSAGWYIKEFSVAEPHVGDLIDPPPSVAQQIQPVVKQMMSALEEGNIAQIWYALPDDANARLRSPVLTFWQRLSASDVPSVMSIMGDLELVRQLHIAAWPDTSAPLEMTWVGPGAVNVVYALPYALASDPRAQALRVELMFVRQQSGWAFYTVRFYGAAIPYSE